jgi:hypothetical protein
VLGGVPTGKVRYDNLKAAVAQVLGFARTRVEADRWVAFRSHFGLEAFYCQPGRQGAHEKGGVEGDIGWFRRNHLVPVPAVSSLAELNAMVDRWDAEDDARRIGMRPRTVGEHFAVEQPLLKPLPAEPFETGLQLSARVDRYGQVTVRTNRYSVPTRLIGRRVRVALGASELVVYDRGHEVARHERRVPPVCHYGRRTAALQAPTRPAPARQGRPAGGRLRRPSSAAKPTARRGSPRTTLVNHV